MGLLGDTLDLVQGSWWPLAAVLLGVMAGALANLGIEQLPRDRPFSGALRACANCGRRRRLWHSLPVIGWFSEGGRCRFCRAHRSALSPIVELVNSALWLLLALRYPPSGVSAALMIFVTGLLILTLIDFAHFLLPDIITMPGIVIGVALTWLPAWPVSLLDAALSAAVGYFAMMALAKAAEWYYREEALGQGDWKMVAMLGAFFGSTKLVVIVLLANGAGAIVGLLMVALLGNEGRQKLPLGTFLGVAGIALAFL